MSELITSTLEADGLLIASINMTDRTMNVFSFELMDALDALMERVENDGDIKAVVLTSGKSTFLAGADLVMVRGFCTEARTASHDRMFEQCGRLGRQFVRLEASHKPWVAAVNGLALGGGLELTMACRARVVSDDPRIQLGLPEVRWGLLPGAGGTQRLPRMVGYTKGLSLLLTGQSIAPSEAVQLGLFSQAVPASDLLETARALARKLVGTTYNPVEKFPHLDQTQVPVWSESIARQTALQFGIAPDDFDLYPAFSTIIDSVLKGARQSLADATAIEMNEFLRLMFNPVAGRMVRTLFLARVRADRELAPPSDLKIVKIRKGPISKDQSEWGTALAKLKIEQVDVEDLLDDHIELVDSKGSVCKVRLQSLKNRTHTQGAEVAAVLAPAGAYGRVIEILGSANIIELQMVAALAVRMWALPWPSCSNKSLLQSLDQVPLFQQASIALEWAAQTDDCDVGFIDVATCLSGVSPGWTGGPLSWLWDEQTTQLPFLGAASQVAWAKLANKLQEACE